MEETEVKKQYEITKEERSTILAFTDDTLRDEYIYSICKREGITYMKVLAQLDEKREDKKTEQKTEENDGEKEPEELEDKKKWHEKKLQQLNEVKDYKFTIYDIFPKEELTPAGSGTYKTVCPHCGLQGDRTEGFIIFPPDATGPGRVYCHSSHKHFRLLEAYALKKKIIACGDGRESGDSKLKVLGGELYTQTLQEFEQEYGKEKFNILCDELSIRKDIQIPGNGKLVSDFAAEMAEIYKTRNVIFIRGDSGHIVEVDKVKTIDKDGKEKVVEKSFVKVEPETFVSDAEMFIKPYTYVKKEKVSKSMSSSHAVQTLKSKIFRSKLPVILRIYDIQQPVMYKGKIVLPKVGYDKRFGSWLPYDAPKIRKDMFSLEDAIKTIKEVFSEFCFATEKDRLFALAGFITPFCRGLYSKFQNRTPVFVYMANRERAGKDYCAGCTGCLYEGVDIQDTPISTGNEKFGSSGENDELRKKITSLMLQGRKRFHSANNKGHVNNSVLEKATTNDTWTDRSLGKNEQVTFNNEMEYSLSGNIGMTLSPDLNKRSRIVNLHLDVEDANERKFKNPLLHEWIMEDDSRTALISAMWKLVENWDLKGRPEGSVPFSSYPEWARVVGGICEVNGLGNPCIADVGDNMVGIAADPETDSMKNLLVYCFKNHRNQQLSKEEIEEIVQRENFMPELDFTNNGNKITFGLRLKRFIGRQMGRDEIPGGVKMIYANQMKNPLYRKYMFVAFDEELAKKYQPGQLNNNLLAENNNLAENSQKDVRVETVVKVTTPVPTDSNEYLIENDSVNSHLSRDSHVQQDSKQSLLSDVMISVEKEIKQLPLEEREKKGIGVGLTAISKITKDHLKREAEEAEKKLIKEKTNRELQYWEAPECANIIAECTLYQVYDYIKNNPKVTQIALREKLGLGAWKFVDQLFDERKIKISTNDELEVSEDG